MKQGALLRLFSRNEGRTTTKTYILRHERPFDHRKLGRFSTMKAQIQRTLRLTIDPHQNGRAEVPRSGNNTFAAWPAPTRIAAWFELDVALAGDPDPVTGYILGIDCIDEAVRTSATRPLARALAAEEPEGLAGLLLHVTEAIERELGRETTAVRLRLTPRHELSWESPFRPREAGPMKNQDRVLLLRDQFEFAAAHRLHCPDREDGWNRETFGKCNNPAGHGHNYKVEVLVESRMDQDGSVALPFDKLEEIVNREVISRFDHHHLNEDCPEFADRNPSVENITLTCHDLLVDPISKAGARLKSVTVWETEKTSCTYPAEAHHGA